MDIITESGMPKSVIAERSFMTRDRLYYIIEGNDVKATEIENLARTLRMTKATRDKVFFAHL